MFPRHVLTSDTQRFLPHNFLGLIRPWVPVLALNTGPGNNVSKMWLSNTKVGTGRLVYQQQEKISPNHCTSNISELSACMVLKWRPENRASLRHLLSAHMPPEDIISQKVVTIKTVCSSKVFGIFGVIFHKFQNTFHQLFWRYGNPDTHFLGTLKIEFHILDILRVQMSKIGIIFIFRVAICVVFLVKAYFWQSRK